MKIINKTKNTILAENASEAKTLKDRGLGLLVHKTPHALILKTRCGIHTFGMRYPIDVLILDQTNKVVALKRNLKPNRIFLWNPNYDIVLELPSCTLEESDTQLKDILSY